jgi:hypothetical protein
MENCEFDDLLSWDNLIYLADFFETSGEMHMSLLGGEPTLHPDFCDFVVYLLERGFHLTVFTSGIMSPAKLEGLGKITENVPVERLSFLCNMNEPSVTPAAEWKRQMEFLSRFGKFTSLGFNVWREEFDMGFLLELIEEHQLARHIRIGLAHPIPGEANLYVHAENLKPTIDRFVSFAPLFDKHKVSPGVDCGLPLCLFDDAQLGQLFKVAKGQVKFNCGPAIDIGTDMSVWACFPLANVNKRSIYDFNSVKEIADFYFQQQTDTRAQGKAGIFNECRACIHRENGLCSGGCLAHLIEGKVATPALGTEGGACE